ncbi:hypothetical protein IC582_001856 [Cucumis melo]
MGEGGLLEELWDVKDANGNPFATFAGFWERCLSMPCNPKAPLLPPKRIVSAQNKAKQRTRTLEIQNLNHSSFCSALLQT